MAELRKQGDPARELAAVSEGACPDCAVPLIPAFTDGSRGPGRCPVCLRAWETGYALDGTPGYGYSAPGCTEWYHVHRLHAGR